MARNSKSTVKFKVNGKECIVYDEYGPEFSLNNYIRNVLNLKGTKAMCHEGGCGACVVCVKGIHPATKETKIFSVNSCLIPVLACHGWEVTTVEGIGDRRKGYHQVQQRLAKFNGTQCGYCTPGWVMNMYSMLEGAKGGMTMKEVENSFAGNLCRCTGYRPIADAFKTFASDAEPRLLELTKDMEDLNLSNGCNKRCSKINCCKNRPVEDHKILGKFSSLYATRLPRSRNNSDEDWCVLEANENETDEMIDIELKDGHKWIKVYNLDDLFKAIQAAKEYMLIAGSTGHGVYHLMDYPETLIDIASVEELKGHLLDLNLVLGAGMSLTEMMEVFLALSDKNEDFFYLKMFHEHMDLVAHYPVRNVGTIGGNLSLKHQHNEFQSDVFLLFETAGATLTLLTAPGKMLEVTMLEYLKTDMKGKVILNAKLPPMYKKCCLLKTYKIMPRAQNAHAIVNAGIFFKYDESMTKIESSRIVFGSISPTFNHAYKTEQTLIGKNIFNNEVLQMALKSLAQEISPEDAPPEPKPAFRRLLAICLFYKAVIALCPPNILSPKVKSGGEVIKRSVSSGLQTFDTNKSEWPLNEPIPKIEALIQCSGEAVFTNDVETRSNEVYAAFVLSTVARGNIVGFNTEKAMAIKGVVAFYTHKDIPGKNSFTPTQIPLQVIEEEILCSGKILYNGQPVAIIVAKTEKIAAKAAKLVEVQYSDVRNGYKPVLSIQDALNAPDAKSRILDAKTIEPTDKGDATSKIIYGEMNIHGQYHYTMETQTAVVRPVDRGFEVYSSTQWLDLTHFAVANCLGIKSSEVDVVVRRLGGAYGAKITRATLVACAAAVVSYKLNTTCRFVLPIETNMRAIGKRLPAYSKFEVGVNDTGEIQYLNNVFYQDDGCTHNEGIVSFTLHHIISCYNSARWKIVAATVTTDTASNTWCRAPGSTEGVAMTEFIMEMIAHETKQDPVEIKIKHMAKDNPLPELINTLKQDADFDNRKSLVMKFNTENRWRKRAIKLLPMLYPVSYFGNFSVLISIFHSDGAVAVTHSGIEMGQGLNTKVAQVVAHSLGISLDKISIKPTETTSSPNAIVSGGSIASECVCFAAIKACDILNGRLDPIKKGMTNATWDNVITKAYGAGVNLQAVGVALPTAELKGYDVYGVVILEVEIDLLTGNHSVLRVDLLEDIGQSLSPNIDVGQIEGAFVMGLGYWTSEELIYDKKTGACLTDRTWTYKPPGIKDIPMDFRVYFRRNSKNPAGVLRSKATGEPATCLSVVIYHALREVVKYAREESGRYTGEWVDIACPCTPENIMSAIRHKIEDFVLY